MNLISFIEGKGYWKVSKMTKPDTYRTVHKSSFDSGSLQVRDNVGWAVAELIVVDEPCTKEEESHILSKWAILVAGDPVQPSTQKLVLTNDCAIYKLYGSNGMILRQGRLEYIIPSPSHRVGENPSDRFSAPHPHQRIVYGPPGTGKSRGIKEMMKDYPDRVIRTTFHPDSDYSTFVGAYKPTMVDDPYETIVQVNKIVRDREGNDLVQSDLKPVRQRHIAYLFVEQAFTKAYVKAWRAWAERPSSGVAESIYLIIEEINRGNCAQVFGDIFQLLDRENGFSQYPIQADEDLRQHLAKEFEGLDFGEKFENVRLGRELVLPSNLYIWATMNTSDQSLFPMDSAFKRRWNWQYVPIKDAAKNWQIVFSVEEGGKVERKTYSWWDFLCRINDVIERLTSSEDKQMGYFFVKPINGEIDEKLLVNKVFFYLWNDVFRDVSDVEELEVMIDGHTQNLKFHHFFNVLDGKENEASINTHILRDFMDKLMGSTSPAVG